MSKTSFQRIGYGKRRKQHLRVEKPDRDGLSQVVKVSVNRDKLC